MPILIRSLKYLIWLALAAACAVVARRLGPWKGLAAFALSMGVLCVGIALVVHHQPPQKITLANYLMGFILPWGYRLARGKLRPIVLTSWTIWVLIGLAIVLAVNARIAAGAISTSPPNSSPRSATWMTFLALAWLIDGGVLLRCIGLLGTSTNRAHMSRSLAPLIAFLIAILATSITLITLSTSPTAASLALLIAGGPPLLVGLGYGLFVLVMLTAGRNARWN
jgi:hypothetical protein